MLSCFRPRCPSLDSQLYRELLNQTFDQTPAEVRVTREYTHNPQPDLDILDEQPFPRISIASDTSISAVRPASCQRLAGTAPPDVHALPPRSPSPRPSSPLQIVNDLDDEEEFAHPSSYRRLSVDAHHPAYSCDWFLTRRPPFQIHKGLLVELVLKHKTGTHLRTCARLTSIIQVGPTWVQFKAEREDALEEAVKEVKFNVPRIWCKLPHHHSILSYFRRQPPIFDVYDPFDPAGDKQICHYKYTPPACVDPADYEEVIRLHRWACQVDIWTGRKEYRI